MDFLFWEGMSYAISECTIFWEIVFVFPPTYCNMGGKKSQDNFEWLRKDRINHFKVGGVILLVSVSAWK